MVSKSDHFDYPLAIAVLVLLVLGVSILSGVSADYSQQRFGRTTYYLFHQLIFGIGIGAILGFIAFKIPLSFFKRWAWLLILFNIFLMLLVFIPGLRVASSGALRWINLGFFNFQPSEFLKLTFIIYVSALLSVRTQKNIFQSWKRILLPFIIVLAVIIIIFYLQSDASTLYLIIAIAIILYFLSGTPLRHNLLLFVILLIGAAFFIFEPYRMNRILVFLGILKDPMSAGYHIEQALIAIGSGGLGGVGLGMSIQKIRGFLPQTMSDSIFAVFAEEVGLIGSLLIVFIFLFFLWRGFKIVKNSKDKFSKLFSAGFCCWICIQAFINIGAIIGMLPLTGIPLPFISYGGSHIIAELIGAGILLNISKNIKR